MTRSSATPLDRQLTPVRRRLFRQSLLRILVCSCLASLAAGADRPNS
jgi:hypothetical protein